MAARPAVRDAVRGLSLCSGIGGLDLALELALGEHYRTVCYVEREAYAAATLVARMADEALAQAPVWDDLLTFDARPWRGVVDLILAGYPCQPFSIAGKQRGTDDPRHLWPEVARIIRECEPEWVFLENVSNHLRVGGYIVARELREMGYRVAKTLRTASEAGAPHKRERLFILAHRQGVDGGVQLRSREPGQAVPQPGGSGEGVADTSRDSLQRRGAAGSVGGSSTAQPREAQQREWSRDAADDRSAEVGDSDGARRASPGQRGQVEAGPQSEARGDRMGYPAGEVREGGHRAAERDARGEPVAADADARVGDSDEQGLEGRDGPEFGGLDELPAWPPGPAERDRWSAILERWPDLAPATEPELRGLADGLSPRVDRLRAAGNGVCPEEAADALLELALALGC